MVQVEWETRIHVEPTEGQNSREVFRSTVSDETNKLKFKFVSNRSLDKEAINKSFRMRHVMVKASFGLD